MPKCDALFHRNKIRDAFLELLKDPNRTGKMPTRAELAAHTKLSPKTIERHMKKLDFTMDTGNARIMTPDVLMALLKTSLKGHTQAVKLWMQIVEGYVEKADVQVGGGIPVEIVLPSDKDRGNLEAAINAINE